MNKLDIVKEKVFENLESKCYGYKKKQAYDHLIGVSNLCGILALKRNLDVEISMIIGLLHDYSTYILGSSFDHAHRSSMLSTKLLNDLNFNEQDITIISTAIYNHSDKEKINDEYSELIKDADVLNQYLNQKDAIFTKEYNKRLEKLL